MRTQWERDAKVRFRISLPSFEKIDSQIPGLKKTEVKKTKVKTHLKSVRLTYSKASNSSPGNTGWVMCGNGQHFRGSNGVLPTISLTDLKYLSKWY